MSLALASVKSIEPDLLAHDVRFLESPAA